MRFPVAIVPVLLALAAPLSAQEAPECGPESHQFDFWIGAWEVTDASGATEYGESDITPIIGGCGVREHYRAGSYQGVSINMYDPVRESWTQLWFDTAGLTLHLTGGWSAAESRMQLADDGTVPNRITWSVLGDGRVRQVWEENRNGTWVTVFDGYYRPR